jgi:hypothetical protein
MQHRESKNIGLVIGKAVEGNQAFELVVSNLMKRKAVREKSLMSQPDSGAKNRSFMLGFGGDDLVKIGEDSQSRISQPRRATFQVLSYSLSKLDVLPGDILRLQLLAKGETPAEISIVAVKSLRRREWVLLLRLFSPPRLLLQNSDRVFRPRLLGSGDEIVAAAAWRKDDPHWRALLS